VKPVDSVEALELEQASAKATQKRPRRTRFERLYAEREEMERQETKEAGALGFVARFLVQASLPYRRPLDKKLSEAEGKPVELATWSKTNGIQTLILQSGHDPVKDGQVSDDGRVKTAPIGLPYGAYPRLVLAWMATEVVRTKNPVITLGANVSDFLAKLDVKSTGGDTGALTAVRNQLYRLLNTTIRVVPANTKRTDFKNIQIGVEGDTGGELWWRKRAEAQTHLWLPTFQLSDMFYEMLHGNAVPIDMRAFRKLAPSPMAMDIYTFATYRLHSLREETHISWRSLEGQMGGGSSMAKFVENFRRALKQVELVYPKAKMIPTPTGLVLHPSPPSVRSAA
jgi:hypothetical protein